MSDTTQSPASDFIGDIHGHADSLKQLLTKLGYEENSDTYRWDGEPTLDLGKYYSVSSISQETAALP